MVITSLAIEQLGGWDIIGYYWISWEFLCGKVNKGMGAIHIWILLKNWLLYLETCLKKLFQELLFEDRVICYHSHHPEIAANSTACLL